VIVISGDHGMGMPARSVTSMISFSVALVVRVPEQGGRVVDDSSLRISRRVHESRLTRRGFVRAQPVEICIPIDGQSILATWVISGRERHVARRGEGNCLSRRCLRTPLPLHSHFAPDAGPWRPYSRGSGFLRRDWRRIPTRYPHGRHHEAGDYHRDVPQWKTL